MRRILSFFIIPIVATFFFASMAYAQTDSIRRTSETVNVRKGKFFSVTLPSNASTGYSWIYLMDPNQNSVQFVKAAYKGNPVNDTPKNVPKLVGAGGTETWKFRALKKGTVRIFLEYVRVFEIQKPAEIHEIIVNINK